MSATRTMPVHQGVEVVPNTSRTHHMLVVRDQEGRIIERAVFNGAQGMVVELAELPTVHQIAVYPPAGTGLTDAAGAPLNPDMPTSA